MIINLFTIFDPSIYFLNLRWIIILLIGIIYISKKYFFVNIVEYIFKRLTITLLKEYCLLIKWFIKSNILVILRIFLLILFLNLFSIFPFVFTPTSHVSLVFSIRLILWTGLFIFGWVNLFNSIIIHLVPLGTPFYLTFFIVLIELVRNLIRPITLSIRLVANITAGHLLISLLGLFTLNNLNYSYLTILLFLILVLLELAVAFIQSYVYSTLFSLYLREL